MDPPPPFSTLPTATITGDAVHSVAPLTQIFPSFPLPEEAGAAQAATAPATDPPAAQTFNHPPYADMIYGAITALKERDGSSKGAIAKYIESVYTGLPPSPTHSALLTHHLKQLKNTGHLVLVKKSYKLARSEDNNSDNISSPNLNLNLNLNRNRNPPPAVVSASAGSKRGRGRPPKLKPAEPIFESSNGSGGLVTVPISTAQLIIVNPQTQEGSKRRPGRPKKVSGGAQVVAKRRGRPLGTKGRPKRLPKSVVVPYANGTAAAVVSPRPRGRPRKGTAAAAVVRGNLPGLPPRAAVGGGVFSPKRRPGRPRKNANVSWGATEPSQQQSEAYGDLKMKLDFFQSKVMEAVGVLRPQLTMETPMSVVAAIQELEGLASMDINAPLREEAPPPPPLAIQN